MGEITPPQPEPLISLPPETGSEVSGISEQADTWTSIERRFVDDIDAEIEQIKQTENVKKIDDKIPLLGGQSAVVKTENKLIFLIENLKDPSV